MNNQNPNDQSVMSMNAPDTTAKKKSTPFTDVVKKAAVKYARKQQVLIFGTPSEANKLSLSTVVNKEFFAALKNETFAGLLPEVSLGEYTSIVVQVDPFLEVIVTQGSLDDSHVQSSINEVIAESIAEQAHIVVQMNTLVEGYQAMGKKNDNLQTRLNAYENPDVVSMNRVTYESMAANAAKWDKHVKTRKNKAKKAKKK